MTTMHTDVFSQMKNEDRKFGERSAKINSNMKVKNHIAEKKHRVVFKNFKPQDIINMGNDIDDMEEEAAMSM